MPAYDPHELWRVQLKLECKTFDDTGRLVRVPCADPDPLPTGYLVRHVGGATECGFAATAPDWFVQRIGGHSADKMINDPGGLVRRLEVDEHQIEIGHFHTYCFDNDIAVVEQPTIRDDGAEAHSIVVDGQRVASASSSRSDDAAAELWIETDPAHRRHGYATVLAQAWATGVQRAGKVAFYSHLHDNTASAALAKHLGVQPLFEIIAVDLT